MFTLVTDHSKYIRVRRGADRGAVEKELKSPVDDVFAGEILLRAEEMEIYVAKPHDSYASVARKFGLTEEELKKINLFRPVYPTCRLYVPSTETRASI